MTPEEFVHHCAAEKGSMLRTYFSGEEQTEVGALIEALSLPKSDGPRLQRILDIALTDAFYTMLLALDGAASLNGSQGELVLHDASGNQLSGSLESPAWEHFQKLRGAT